MTGVPLERVPEPDRSDERMPQRAGRVRLVVLLGFLSAFGPLSIDMYLPALPAMARDLHAPTSAAQLTLTGCLAGLAIGQLMAGPVSDARGRRVPLLAGVAAYAAASALCAAAPSVWLLLVLRFVQGFAGGAGIVIARAVVRDLWAGDEMARIYAVQLLITGTTPILAPIIGGQLLRVTNWRGVFTVLALIDVVLVLASARWQPETWPPARRQPGGLGELARQRRFDLLCAYQGAGGAAREADDELAMVLAAHTRLAAPG